MLYVLKGDPVPLARPRFSHKNVYDGQKTRRLMAGIAVQSQHDGRPLYEGNLHLNMTFYMKIPQKGKRTAVREGGYHIYKPDLSNLIKFVEDVCTKVLYHDDSLICSIVAAKKYSITPRTEFEVRVL